MQKKESASLQPETKQDPALASEKIQRQLQRILDSTEFLATQRQRDLLQFVVMETLAGRDHEIKGFTIATRVFGRNENFDQSTDPIVAIQANSLRRALERYYLVEGKQDPVFIDIPKGTYVPTFREQTGAKSGETAQHRKRREFSLDSSWPSVLVRPFENWTGDPEQDYFGLGLATEIVVELTRQQDLRVMMQTPEAYGRRAADSRARFLINGSIRKDAEGIKVAVHLIDSKSSSQIWADTKQCKLEASSLSAFQEETARTIATQIAGEHGSIPMALSRESRSNPPSELKTYDAILRYYDYDLNSSPESYIKALEALEQALMIEPECAQIWTMLARLYLDNYSMEYFDLKVPLNEAIAYAEKGSHLNRGDQRASIVLAFARLLANDLPAGLAEVEKAHSLSLDSLFFMDTIGYLFTLLGEWKRGPALIRKAIELNPGHHPYVLYGLWLDCFRREEYEQARLETLQFRTYGDFWNPLVRAATLGQMGRSKEGKLAVQELLQLKPEFPTRGRRLIKHYIKFDDIVDRVIEGLNKVGLGIK